MLCACQGGHEFFTDLTHAIRAQHQFSTSTAFPYTFDFVRLKSYENMGSTGTVSITLDGVDLKTLAGRDVLLVEDIVDTGVCE